jgi:hypothetical protein
MKKHKKTHVRGEEEVASVPILVREEEEVALVPICVEG